MPKNVLKGLIVVLGVTVLYGCSSTAKSFEIKRYVQEKDRVDQVMEEGNAGFLVGTPKPEDRSEFKKTRKTYVVEVSTGEEIIGKNVVEPARSTRSASMTRSTSAPKQLTATLDVVITPPEPREPSLVEYTVLKDDTLQKISKKFYDSYSAWPKIYELNKEVIGNPDRIKPGIVIQIPME